MPDSRAMLPLYGITIFLSAALMFLLQLVFARMVLPLLGGSPAVWNTAMVFYQAVLLGGYGYAHGLGQKFRLKTQVVIHAIMLVLAAFTLPLSLPAGAIPPGDANPIPWLLGILTLAVGAPFFAISTTSPLLQRWFSRSGHPRAKDPYFLYAASNAGSLIGLLGYPLLIEPYTTLKAQAGAWSISFGLLVAITIACGLLVRNAEESRGQVRELADAVPMKERFRWLACSMIPSSLMLSVTAYISSDIAAVPLLWVMPLALYLLTFIVVFASRPFLPHAFVKRLLPLVLVIVVMVLGTGSTTPILLLAGIHLLAFSVVALVCHGELAARRPPAAGLTGFYFWMSLGGVLGGIFNALLAPVIFKGLHEYPVMLVAAAWLCLPGRSAWKDVMWAAVPAVIAIALSLLLPLDLGSHVIRNLAVLGLPCVLCFLMSRQGLRFALGLAGVLFAARLAPQQGMKTLIAERSFFGIHRVTNDGKFNYLFHGKTVHGIQNLDPVFRKVPLSYYHPTGPLGQIFASRSFGPVAAVGLGAGAAAMYGRAGEEFTFFEIDPAVERIASDPAYFSYLADSPAEVKVVIGDARLKLAGTKGLYDLIILDAYGSDSVPVHLLTREALAMYAGKLAPQGLIAFHISNLHMDLRPVIANLAADARMSVLFQEDADFPEEEAAAGKASSRWAVLARGPGDLAPLLKNGRWEDLAPDPRIRVWTDDYSSILPLLDFRLR